MNFNDLYDIFHKLKYSCYLTDKNFHLNRIFLGSGGSDNIIVEVIDRANNSALIFKAIPKNVYFNVKKKPDYDQLEIKMYKFLTQKYIMTNRSPHIVGIYNHQICKKLDKFIMSIKPSKKKCPTYEDQLTKNIPYNKVQDTLCNLLQRYEFKLIEPEFDIIMLERCQFDVSYALNHYLAEIHKTKSPSKLKLVQSGFIYYFRRIIFQLIFTLALIKDDYPGFQHGDFFMRNILINHENDYQDNDYVAYHYKQKIFYMQANGAYSKINDFGYTVIANELQPNVYDIHKPLREMHHNNPFNQKTDLFNFFHDLYDGQDLGGNSFNTMVYKLKLPKKKVEPFRQFLSRYFKINIIDRVNKINRQLLDQTWNIDKLKILEDTLKTPDEYLMGNYFKVLQFLPNGSNIVRQFNEPK